MIYFTLSDATTIADAATGAMAMGSSIDDAATSAMAHEHRATLRLTAWENADCVVAELAALSLGSAQGNSENFLISSTGKAEDFHRRCPSTTRKGRFRVTRRDNPLTALRDHVEAPAQPEEESDLSPHPPLLGGDVLPFRMVSAMEILSLLFDEQHVDQPLNRAKMRMGILARVLGFTWGLETDVLRVTADALAPSFNLKLIHALLM